MPKPSRGTLDPSNHSFDKKTGRIVAIKIITILGQDDLQEISREMSKEA
jgi:hypothetical protein